MPTVSDYMEKLAQGEEDFAEGMASEKSEEAPTISDGDIPPTEGPKEEPPPLPEEGEVGMMPRNPTADPTNTDQAIAQAIKIMADAAVNGQPEAGQVLITIANKVKDVEAEIATAPYSGGQGAPGVSELPIAEEAGMPGEEAQAPMPEEIVGGEEAPAPPEIPSAPASTPAE